MRTRKRNKHWLTLHSRTEKGFTEKILVWLRTQGSTVAKAINQGMPSNMALALIQPEAEREQLLEALLPLMQRAMLVGAASMRETAALQKAFDGGDYEDFSIDLPPQVVSGIRSALRELAGQAYWDEISQWSKKNLGKVIEAGIQAGLSNPQIARQIRENTGGAIGKKRSILIARSEVTGCLNRGHLESLNELADHDPETTKQWSAIIDDRTRNSHAALSGQSVPVDALFSNHARYPGDCLLPASERAGCRCVLVGGFAD